MPHTSGSTPKSVLQNLVSCCRIRTKHWILEQLSPILGEGRNRCDSLLGRRVHLGGGFYDSGGWLNTVQGLQCEAITQ